MQRQSLGGPLPASKFLKDDYPSSSSSSPSSSPTAAPIRTTAASFYARKECKLEEDAPKKLTRGKLHKSTPPETYIHLIPLLTFVCFLILYLSSHNPSAIDLAEFKDFKPISNLQAQGGINVEVKKGDVLAVRGLTNLKQAAKMQWHHRKLARV